MTPIFFGNSSPIRIDYAFPLKADRYNDGGGKFNIQMRYEF